MANIYGSIYDDNNTTGPDGLFNSMIYGTSDGDYIFADDGNDFVFAGAGDDYVDGWNGIDALYSEDGNDLLLGWNGDDLLVGGNGNDTLYGENDNDLLYGQTGNDYLDGGAGKDFLNGYGSGTDLDTLVGGIDADKFVLGQQTLSSTKGFAYYLGSGYATIVDFKNSQGDKFQVYGSLSSINDYQLNKTKNLSGGAALDTAIYYKNDLIAVVQDTTDVSRSRDFSFVS